MDFHLDDVTHISRAAHDFVMHQLANATYGWFPPFVLDRPNVFFGIGGGAEWTGAAFDPQTGLLYVSASHVPWMITVTKEQDLSVQDDSPGRKLYLGTCSACHGAWGQGQGHAPPLLGIARRLDEPTVRGIIEHGRATMPPQPLTEEEGAPVVHYLFTVEEQETPKKDRNPYTFTGYPGCLIIKGILARSPRGAH